MRLLYHKVSSSSTNAALLDAGDELITCQSFRSNGSLFLFLFLFLCSFLSLQILTDLYTFLLLYGYASDTSYSIPNIHLFRHLTQRANMPALLFSQNSLRAYFIYSNLLTLSLISNFEGFSKSQRFKCPRAITFIVNWLHFAR